MKGCSIFVLLIFLVPIVIAVILVTKLILKGKNSYWKGEIIDKSHTSKRGSFEDSNKIEHSYILKVKMENGSTRNISVSPQLYDECKVGDVIEKPKGDLYPKKI